MAAALGHQAADALGQQRPVRQPGQRIVQRLMAQLGLALLAVGDVLDVHDHALELVAGPDPGGAQRHPELVSIAPPQAAFVAHHPRSLCPLRCAVALETLEVLGVDDVEQDRTE